MSIITIDLGTTNIKVAAFTNNAKPISILSCPVEYERNELFVEFNPEVYYEKIEKLIADSYKTLNITLKEESVQIVLTGQAESLIVLDINGKPLRNGISWLDMRSQKECIELAEQLDAKECYRVTGQPGIIPTWPITKILWLQKNEPNLFEKVGKYLLLKDYVQYRLTGKMFGEYSIYAFSHYFDATKKIYWDKMLKLCKIKLSQLPELTSPCSILGEILPAVSHRTGLPRNSIVNTGTLDHFAGMIGTGNLKEGMISESAGTVSSIATFLSDPSILDTSIPFYCGPFPNSYIYLPVCESGGMSLEWYRNQFMGDFSFSKIDEECSIKSAEGKLMFLPYITGVNSPDFNPDATGVFYGVNASHGKFDFALAIMYGVACLLRKNIDCFKNNGINVERIISTGGGAKSALWSQIKADICGLPVIIPEVEEAPSLGGAIIGSVANGAFPNYEEAVKATIKMNHTFYPNTKTTLYEQKYQLFCKLFDVLTPIFPIYCK
ncbi:MAG: FGGY-family carbohydrate kinase [Ruminiclostridium sp.]